LYNNAYARNYNNVFNQQNMNEQIDYQINQLQQMKRQIENNTQQPAINQTFQLAPTNNHTIRYANTIDDVFKEQVFYDTPFFSKDMSVLWIKTAKGDIKSYELNEIIPKDNKDFEIEYLKSQIEELKGMIKNDTNVTNVVSKQNETNSSGHDETTRNEFKESKSTSISKIPNGKKK